MGKSWSQEEIDFLIRFYATSPTEDLAEELGRTRQAVKAKALKLHLKKDNPNLVIVGGKKRCSVCGEMLDLEYFCKERKSKIGYSSGCRLCRSKRGTEILEIEKLKQETAKKRYTCYNCGGTKPGWEFKWSTRKKRRETKCNECRRELDIQNKVKRIQEGRDW